MWRGIAAYDEIDLCPGRGPTFSKTTISAAVRIRQHIADAASGTQIPLYCWMRGEMVAGRPICHRVVCVLEQFPGELDVAPLIAALLIGYLRQTSDLVFNVRCPRDADLFDAMLLIAQGYPM